MTVSEFRNLRLNDPAYDSKGRLAKVYDIDRRARAVKTSMYGAHWRDYHAVDLPEKTEKTGTTVEVK